MLDGGPRRRWYENCPARDGAKCNAITRACGCVQVRCEDSGARLLNTTELLYHRSRQRWNTKNSGKRKENRRKHMMREWGMACKRAQRYRLGLQVRGFPLSALPHPSSPPHLNLDRPRSKLVVREWWEGRDSVAMGPRERDVGAVDSGRTREGSKGEMRTCAGPWYRSAECRGDTADFRQEARG